MILSGEASDGELAYPLIIKEKPDILITDIRMPFMDGLELSKLVKEKLPDIRIMLLTGYSEFEYAKQAIEIGVEDYLLKPISAAKLLEALGRVRDAILKVQEEKALLERYSKEMRENTEWAKIKFFNRLLVGNLSMSEILEEGRRYGMELMASCYQVVLFKIMSVSQNAGTQEDVAQIASAYDAIDGITESLPYVFAFHRGIDGWTFLVTADDEAQMNDRNCKLRETLTQIMRQWPELEFFGAIGQEVSRLRNIKDSFKEADKVFVMRFVLEPNQVIDGTAIQEKMQGDLKENAQEHIAVSGIVQVGELRTALNRFLNNGTEKEIEEFCDTYLAQMEQDNFSSTLLRQYLIVDISAEILAFTRKLSSDEAIEKDAEQLKYMLQNIHTPSELKNYLVDFLKNTMHLRDTVSDRKYTDLINAAKKQIEKNYMTEDISLNSVAVSVGMSPSYFSTVFSKEVGMTFIEYLTEIRMTKAKELLMCSPMKMTDIAFEIGYRDPHYFSYIFKKSQGCSPKEYRARRKD